MSPLLLIAAGLALVDLATTLIGVRLFGSGIEANPVHRAVLRRFGAKWFCLFYAVVAVALLRLCAVDEYLLIGLSSGLALAVLNNLRILGGLRRR
jgi:hypothetical protein